MGVKRRIGLLIEAFRLSVRWLCFIAFTGILILYNRLTKARFKPSV